MHRHHPYNSSFEGAPARRGGGPPPSAGPDRSHFRGGAPRGRGRGRGGGGGGGPSYGGYEGGGGPAPYEQGPPQGDSGFYNGYDGGNGQDPYYQNGNYGNQAAPPPPLPTYGGSQNAPEGYGQPPYEGYEDNAGGEYDQGGYGSRPKRFRKEDKVHVSIIEDRVQREKPCRTLFIRNIKYETNSDDVRRIFEEHGDVKTFFDLISNRGMVFVTYFDLRAAERARERLQGSDISGRPIDVHYSLPRDDGPKSDNVEMQGTVVVTLRNSMSGQPIDDNEVRRKFQQFGDIKTIRPVDNHHQDQRYVEFYDIRSCEEAFERLRHQPLQDGIMDIVLAWNPEAASAGGAGRKDGFGDRGRDWDDGPRGPPRGRGGFRGRGRGRGRGGMDDFDRRPSLERDFDRGPPSRRHDDDFGGGRGGGRGGYGGDRFDSRGGGGGYGGNAPGPLGSSGPPGSFAHDAAGWSPSGYNTPSAGYGGSPTGYGPPPISPKGPPLSAYGSPASAPPPVDERVEQARKVQQLLAALKQPAPAAPASAPPPPMANGYNNSMPPAPPAQAPVSQGSYYGQPPAHHQASLAQPPAPQGYYNQSQVHNQAPHMPPAQPPYGSGPPPASTYGAPPPAKPSTPSGGPPSAASLPPHVLAMLQQTAQAHGQPPPIPPLAMPPASAQYGGGMSPGQAPQTMGGPPPSYGGANATQQNYQQLMSYLQNQQKR